MLVITGHVLQGPLSENLLRYIIYSFHMPLFIGISGYLINTDKLKGDLFLTIQNYFFRLVLPWGIAVIAYTLIVNHTVLPSIPLKAFAGMMINAFVWPFYHLWFISAFLSWLFLTFLFLKIGLSYRWLLLTGLIISLLFYLVDYHYLQLHNHTFKSIARITLHTFRPYFYFFFVFGIYLKKNLPTINLNLTLIATLVFSSFQIALFFIPSDFLQIPLTFMLNSCLIYLMVYLATLNKLPFNKTIEWIGCNSLGIYLWHLLPILFLQTWCGKENLKIFYLFSFSSEMLFIIVLFFLTKIKIINRILFGALPANKFIAAPVK